MAIRTTTTFQLSAECAPSADSSTYSFELLLRAYLDCRRNKRNTRSALTFEQDVERNLWQLHLDILDGSYTPGRSICFVITRPKPREVWAAEFRDRIVHHLMCNAISPIFYAGFIADSCACIPGRGTLYGAKRLESKVRSITQNWSKPAHYLKLDLANFFVSIDKHVVRELLARKVSGWWLQLAELVLFHDPRQDFELRGDPALLEHVPAHKRLTSQPAHLGLPIGNLSSQFFANVLLDALDQHIKHDLRCRHYVRYVDDMVLLHESPQWLNAARADFKADAKKEKWWQRLSYAEAEARGVDWFRNKEPRQWPRKVWKHYYAMPKDIWKPELVEFLPSKNSGVILLSVDKDGWTKNGVVASVERRATPCRDAERICPADAVDIARLASLRMWDAFDKLEKVAA